MTITVLFLALFIVLSVTCLGIVITVAYTAQALAKAEPVIKIVQEYNVTEGSVADIYNEKGEIKDKDLEMPTMDEVLAHVNALFTDEDEVKSDG